MSNLVTRVLSAVVLLPLVLAALWAGGLSLALLLSVFAAAGAWELFQLARATGTDTFDAIGIPVAAALPLAVYATWGGWLLHPWAAAAVVFVAMIGVVVWGRSAEQRPLESVAVTTFGAVYTGGTLSTALLLRHHPWVVGDRGGAALVLFPLVVTWATDIGAYIVGRAISGRKLHPTVSPGKTRSGAIGGTMAGVAAAGLWNALVLRPEAQVALSWWTAVIVGLVLALAAQVGDLAESLFKRQAGVKDSSRLIPGHGGVLDRLDALYFTLPVALLLLGRLLLPAPG